MLMKNYKKDGTLSDNDDVVISELDLNVFNFIDNPNYETNRVKDTLKILNDQKNFVLHLEAVGISTPVTWFLPSHIALFVVGIFIGGN